VAQVLRFVGVPDPNVAVVVPTGVADSAVHLSELVAAWGRLA
jgi:hypothetical protein